MWQLALRLYVLYTYKPLNFLMILYINHAHITINICIYRIHAQMGITLLYFIYDVPVKS